MGAIVLPKPATNMPTPSATRSHVYKRIDRMTLMGLSLLKLIASTKMPRPQLKCGPATERAGKGTGVGMVGSGNTQAAHNLPRDLLLNGRSFWAYGELLDEHPRIKMQISYASAATMILPSEVNYVDSCWEKQGLPEAWLRYLDGVLDRLSGLDLSDGAMPGAVSKLAETFQGTCRATLTTTIASIRESDVYRRLPDKLDSIMATYQETLSSYQPVRRLESMWHIYQLEKYRTPT
jgi:hypothetical protein